MEQEKVRRLMEKYVRHCFGELEDHLNNKQNHHEKLLGMAF